MQLFPFVRFILIHRHTHTHTYTPFDCLFHLHIWHFHIFFTRGNCTFSQCEVSEKFDYIFFFWASPLSPEENYGNIKYGGDSLTFPFRKVYNQCRKFVITEFTILPICPHFNLFCKLHLHRINFPTRNSCYICNSFLLLFLL